MKRSTEVLLCTLYLVFVYALYQLVFKGGTKGEVDTFPVSYIDTIPPQELSLDDSIRAFIKFLNVSHPDIVYAQAVLESGNFTSNNFKKRNNLFGMKRATRRANMNKGDGEWAKYDMWEYSIIDYALYQATYMTDDSGRRLSREEYLDKLGRSYASDPKYAQKVDKLSELWAKEED